ncbi:MAG TPA: magnesium transporter [Candidatus Binatia bacterium]|jgi:magnesium transporter
MSNQQELIDALRSSLEHEPPDFPSELLEQRDADLADLLNHMSTAEAAHALGHLPLNKAVQVLDQPDLRRRGTIVEQLDPAKAAQILEALSSDERAYVLRRMSPHERHRMLPNLSAAVRAEVEVLLKYPPKSAGGIMTTEFVRLEPAMTVSQAIDCIRTEAAEKESIYACYVLEPGSDRLLGAVSLKDLIMAGPATAVTDVMRRRPISVGVHEPQERVAQKISKYNLLAVPVLEKEGRVVGFVTVDDVIDVMVEEETENALRMGGVEPGALDQPYMTTSFATMVKKRATWLVVLFIGEMLTATAMGHFEGEISKAVVLALFVPLIISSGGNSGSQASTIIIRAMALGEFRLGDWWKIASREVLSGLALGAILGSIGFVRIALWSAFSDIYGPHWVLVALTVAFSLVGVVLWGTISGSMLPLILRRLGADPATSSAPFVATLVDVTGLVIYFSVAMVVMHGTIL